MLKFLRTNTQTHGQTDGPKTICPRSIDVENEMKHNQIDLSYNNKISPYLCYLHHLNKWAMMALYRSTG